MKIYVRGFFFSNLGDDLFIHLLAKRYPQHTFVLVVNKGYEGTFLTEPNIQVVRMGKIRRGICKLWGIDACERVEKKTDISVIISGSVFQEFPHDTEAMNRLLRMPGRYHPTYVLGANFGPYCTEQYRNTAKEYFAGLQDICFRDRWSCAQFPDIQQVRYAPDIVFNIDKIVEKPAQNKKRCVISIMNFDQKEYLRPYRKQYEEFILRAIEEYASQQYEIVLMSFCKKEGDEEAVNRIQDACSAHAKERVFIQYYNGTNWEDMVQVIGGANCMIGTRFHSMILAAVYGVPVLPVLYNDKMLHVLEDLGCEACGIRLHDLDKTAISNAPFMVLPAIGQIKELADRQFAGLDAIL